MLPNERDMVAGLEMRSSIFESCFRLRFGADEAPVLVVHKSNKYGQHKTDGTQVVHAITLKKQ